MKRYILKVASSTLALAAGLCFVGGIVILSGGKEPKYGRVGKLGSHA